jgi:hypothetical protein
MYEYTGILLGARPILHISRIKVNYIWNKRRALNTVSVIMRVTSKMQLYGLIYYSYLALHVSGDIFAHHQEHLTVFTVSGSVHPGCCWLVSWMS